LKDDGINLSFFFILILLPLLLYLFILLLLTCLDRHLLLFRNGGSRRSLGKHSHHFPLFLFPAFHILLIETWEMDVRSFFTVGQEREGVRLLDCTGMRIGWAWSGRESDGEESTYAVLCIIV